MGSTADHADALRKLLPPGPVWDGEHLYQWLTALAGTSARVDAAAEKHLLDFLPATCGNNGTYIDDWAELLRLPEAFESDAWDGYTNAQKAAIIRARLQGRGDPSLGNLQATLETLFDDPAVVLSHQEHLPFYCDVGACGSEIGSAWAAVWTLRYINNVLNASPDDFASWDTVGAVVNNAAQSPATLGATADKVTPAIFSGDTYYIATAIDGTSDGDDLRGRIWVRAADSAAHGQPCQIALRQRDGSTSITGDDVTLSQYRWDRLVVEGSAGTGGVDPELRLFVNTGSGAAPDLYLSYAMAGIRAIALEQRAGQLAPIHTAGEFLIKGEA